MKKLLSFIVVLPMLSACIFSDKEANKQPQNAPGGLIDGYISMLDARGFTAEGALFRDDILAEVVKASASSRGFYSLVKEVVDTSSREMKCTPTKVKQLGAKAVNGYISVGKLTLGMGGAGSEIPYSEKYGVYYGALAQGKVWKAGVYSVKAEGSTEGSGFQMNLSLPEVLEDASVNGTLIENGPMTLQVNKDWELKWKKQTTAPDIDYMLFHVIAEKDSKSYEVTCAIKETEVDASWVIPADKIKDFTTSMNKVMVSLNRANVAKAQDPSIGTVAVEGVRTSQTTVTFAN